MNEPPTAGDWEIDYEADVENMARCLEEGAGTNRQWVAVENTDDDAGGHVAYCHPCNAAIIASAPELLSLLRECSTALADLLAEADPTGLECQEQWACVAECKAAIAKAEGRAQA